MANQPKNVLDGFWQQVQTNVNGPCYSKKVKGSWAVWNWTLVGEKVARLASAFQRAGLKPGDRVAIFSENMPEWAITDFACQTARLVSVPLYPTQTDAQVQYILDHAGVKIAVVRGGARIHKVLALPGIEKVIEIEDGSGSSFKNPKVTSFEDFLTTGSVEITKFAKDAATLNLSELSTIVYTSGTTANPKGVMLSHGNTFAQSSMVGVRSTRTKNDVILSYLPLSHITERVNLFRQAISGYAIYFTQSIDNVAADLKEVRPTSFVAVPRVWEKFQEAIQAKLRAAPAGKQRIFAKTQDAGAKHFELRRNGHKVPFLLNLRVKILQRLVGRKLKAALGFDRTHHYVSGAAPLSIETIKFFYSLGMPIVEGYGLSECAGASHINLPDSPVYGTVGPHIDGSECKIASDGEILIKGGHIFQGYYKDPEQTRETLIDGWLHTGD
ncbi:MAG: AMP-binding protein, partial [Bdellovibrionia bacterium]